MRSPTSTSVAALSMLALASLPGERSAYPPEMISQKGPPAAGEVNRTHTEELDDDKLEPTFLRHEIISRDITRDTLLRRGTTYVVEGEVHVRTGVTLRVEDDVTILLRNGYRPMRAMDTSALVFDSGSRLEAQKIVFGSADESGNKETKALNGGVYFCGSYRTATTDGISSEAGSPPSLFKASCIIADHIGRPDPREGDGDDNVRDDIDAVSIIGVRGDEWLISTVESICSGDDGIDITNSSIELDTLVVMAPTEDGINVTSSSITVRKSCTVLMSRSDTVDREIFDFEINNGPVLLAMPQGALVTFSGYWGNRADDALVTSLDMPRRPSLGGPNTFYEFSGPLSKGPLRVDSNTTD